MNREHEQRRVQFRVGLFVLAALAAFLGLVYLLGAQARLFESRYTVHADFTEVGGLATGATVRLAGVQIGRVTDVRLPAEPGGKVRIDMSVARQYSAQVRKDSVARIETQGLLGDKIVEITVGSAAAPPVQPGEVLLARDPTDIGQVLSEGAGTVQAVAELTQSLRDMAQAFVDSRIIEDAAATVAGARAAADEFNRTAKGIGRTADRVASVADALGRDVHDVLTDVKGITSQAGRIVDQIERGKGWAHVLLYEEPVTLRRLDELIASTQRVIDGVERGEGAVGVLTSAESAAAARRFLSAMERFGAAAERPEGEGLLMQLLFDPQYKTVLDDLRVVTRNLRDVSDRIAGGRGTLGELVKDEPADANIRQASRDLQTALANLREITGKLNEGEGTLGALIADPTLYERLVAILDGAQRSFLLRGLLRGLGRDRGDSDAAPRGADDRRP